jgi:predicted HTH transcriptional regulator
VIRIIDAMSNSEGGIIIVGVMDQKEIRGFYGSSEESKKTIQNKLKAFCEPSIDTQMDWINLEGKPLMVIRVEE